MAHGELDVCAPMVEELRGEPLGAQQRRSLIG